MLRSSLKCDAKWKDNLGRCVATVTKMSTVFGLTGYPMSNRRR